MNKYIVIYVSGGRQHTHADKSGTPFLFEKERALQVGHELVRDCVADFFKISLNNVSTIEQFVQVYGTKTLGLLVSKYILWSPEFRGSLELAEELGRVLGQLEAALEDFVARSK